MVLTHHSPTGSIPGFPETEHENVLHQLENKYDKSKLYYFSKSLEFSIQKFVDWEGKFAIYVLNERTVPHSCL